MPFVEIQADIFASLESISRAFRRFRYGKTSENVSQHFKTSHLIMYLMSTSQECNPGVKLQEFKSTEHFGGGNCLGGTNSWVKFLDL